MTWTPPVAKVQGISNNHSILQGGKEIKAYQALSITSGTLLEPKENLTIFITLGYDPVNSFKLAIQ